MELQPRNAIGRLLRHAIVQNVMALSAAQVATYIFPLITIPYLARVLGVAGWGLVAFAQAFAAYITLVVEYGFSLSGTREVARHRENKEELSEIVAGVLGAKGLFAMAAIPVAFAAHWWIPIFRSHPDLLWAGTFYALAQAFSVMWYFQGIERLKLVAALNFSAKALATVGIFAIIRTPSDGWKVLALQGAGATISFLVGTAILYRTVRFRIPVWSNVWTALRIGWSMFLFRSSVSLYTVGNSFILGLFVPPQFVGYYAGAEKISRAFISLLSPVTKALFPRLSHLVQNAREQAARLARISLAVMGLGGVTMGVLVFFLAPFLIRIILGQSYAPAVPVLRILALLPPLIALSNVFGIQWMLPLGLDRSFNTIILLAGAINLGLAVLLAPGLKDIGMALAVVGAELFVSGAMYVRLRWHRLDPVSYLRTA